MTQGFEYPKQLHSRRHGPDGYRDYESYRDWLRDEFMFRCVYCLDREQWNGREAGFHIDHFIPVAMNESRRLDYDNLLYACASCNTGSRSLWCAAWLPRGKVTVHAPGSNEGTGWWAR